VEGLLTGLASAPTPESRRVAEDRLVREEGFDAVITTDALGTITSFNSAAERMLGYRGDEVIGQGISLLAAAPSEIERTRLIGLVRGEARLEQELHVRRKDGSTVVVEARAATVLIDGHASVVVVGRDLTRVKTAEAELRLSDAAIRVFGAEQGALRRIATAVAEGAPPGRVFMLVAQESARLHGVEHGLVVRFTGPQSAAIAGSWPESAASEIGRRRAFSLRRDSSVRRVLRTGAPARLADAAASSAAAEERVAAPINLDSVLWGALSISTARSGGLQAEAEWRLSRFAALIAPVVVEAEARVSLERHAAQQLALATIGARAVRSAEVGALFAEAAKIVATTLRVESVTALELISDTRELVVRARTGRGNRYAEDARVPYRERTQTAFAIDADVPVVVDDVRKERRFAASAEGESATRSTISVGIHLPNGCWGVLEASSREAGHFGPSDAHFLQGVANVLASAITRRRSEELLRHRAMHDPLTGAANRTLLGDRLGNALARAERASGWVGVIVLDVDGFKVVNDTLGHAAGDALLVTIAQRLRAAVRVGDTVARLGGDEFAVLCDEVGGEHEAAEVAERVVRSFDASFELEDDVSVTASAGLVLRRGPDAAEASLRDAHTAATRAKANGRDRFEVFDESMRTRVIERRRIESDLRRAIGGGELVVYYQPIVSLASGSMDGVEALVRWNHPERGLIGPGAFIPVAEETGQIVALGHYVLAHACRDAARWKELHPGRAPLHVSVNLSAYEIAEEGIVDNVLSTIAEWGVLPEEVGLEITETVVLGENRAYLERLVALRAAGIRVILDDFGTGYSSLSYLRRFPLDVLKLDRSFVTGLGSDPGATAIVSAVTQMAQTLKLVVVAEGVERPAQLRTLEALGCELAQGYLFARPMSCVKIERLLNTTPPWLARRFGEPRAAA
jgi:diguanylate cyclase (GGDEF)-like protein/PAS domain S-box-containing protein